MPSYMAAHICVLTTAIAMEYSLVRQTNIIINKLYIDIYIHYIHIYMHINVCINILINITKLLTSVISQ